ncbi:MAG: M23 family metallopeptidase [Rhodospirillales bacterium]
MPFAGICRFAKVLALTSCLLLAACGGGSGGGNTGSNQSLPKCGGPSSVPWVDGAWVQPVPEWGSPVRLSLPFALNMMVLSQLGAYGSHQGAHAAGLDHVWLQSTNWVQNSSTTPIMSMAAGTVTRIDSNGPGLGYSVTIDYGQGLLGKHMEILNPAVKVGDTLKEGDVVGPGFGITGEYNLQDENRCDGQLSQVGGYSNVSPFDYLKSDVQAALISQYQAQVVAPYFSAGQSVISGNRGSPTSPIRCCSTVSTSAQSSANGYWQTKDGIRRTRYIGTNLPSWT